jgi:hypothetical protein
LYISTYEGITGMKKTYDNIKNETKFDSIKFLINSNYVDNSTFDINNYSVGDINIFDNFLFILMDKSRKLIIINLDTSLVLNSFNLPGQFITWKGIYVHGFLNQNSLFDIYLTNESPSEIWKFHFLLSSGFSSCSWVLNGINWV